MAGWDDYIDSIIAKCPDDSGSSHCDKACIIGLNGSKWTSDAHKNALKITQAEASAIASGFSSNSFSNFQASGVFVEGQKYQFLRAEDKLMLAKKKGSGSLTLQSSKSAIVIAHCAEGKQHGSVNSAVAAIAEYLESQNM